MKKKTIYIAYGSNINLEQMACRCPTATKFCSGTISDYELEFRQVATIVPKTDSVVPVLLWEFEPSDEKSLDRYEVYPSFYRKEYFELEIDGEIREAMAYVMNGGQIDIPSEAYYNGIKKGYINNSLDTAYLEKALEQACQTIDEAQDYEEGFQMGFE
jgi:gamma-glutamylcyclotransferase (GGCT)/AIG2-like uncharacterized protein YtfP